MMARLAAVLVAVFVLWAGAAFAQAVTQPAYRLGPSDKVRVTVFGEPDLSGEFLVSGTGVVALPLVGGVPVGELTIPEAELRLAERLKQGFLNNPRVSVEVLNFRPFYILGEVNNPGSYAYVDGMTVLNAVALGGGYTYRADKKDIKVRRDVNGQTREVRVQQETTVMPGDVVEVGERFF